MKNNSNGMSTGAAILFTLGIMLCIGWIISLTEPKCCMSGCDNDAREGGRYCYLHQLSYDSYGNPDYNAVYRESVRRRESYSRAQRIPRVRTVQPEAVQAAVHQVLLRKVQKELQLKKRTRTNPMTKVMKQSLRMMIMTGTDIGLTAIMRMG